MKLKGRCGGTLYGNKIFEVLPQSVRLDELSRLPDYLVQSFVDSTVQ